MKVLAAAVLVFGLVACGAKEEAKKEVEKTGGSAPAESSKSDDSSKESSNTGTKTDSKDGSKTGSTNNTGSKSEDSGTTYHGEVGKNAICENWTFKIEDAKYAADKLFLKPGACPAKNEYEGAIVKTCPGEKKSQSFYENGNYDKPVATVEYTATRVVYGKASIQKRLSDEELEAAMESGKFPDPVYEDITISEAEAAKWCPNAKPVQ